MHRIRTLVRTWTRPGWQRTLAILFVAQLLSGVGFSMIFPFLPNYVGALGSSTGLSLVFLAGAVFSVQGITMMIASPVWGAVADRVGRKPMVLRAMVGGSLVVLLMAFVQNAEQLVVLRAIQGLITGVVASTNALVASVAPRGRSGFAMGALATALTSGVALGPVLGGILADLYGYRAAFVITAGLLLVGGILVQFGVREEFTPRRDGGREGGIVADWNHVLRTPGVAVAFAARFTAWLGRGVLVPILPLFMPLLVTDTSRLATLTGLVIGVAAASATLSGIWLGDLGDRIGHRAVLIGASTVAALAYLPMAFVTAPWQLLLLNAVAGFAVGGVMPSLSALISRATVDAEIGSAFGLDNATVAASRAVAPLVGVGVASIVAIWAGEAVGYRATFLSGGLLFLATLAIAAWFVPGRRAVAEAAAGD